MRSLYPRAKQHLTDLYSLTMNEAQIKNKSAQGKPEFHWHVTLMKNIWSRCDVQSYYLCKTWSLLVWHRLTFHVIFHFLGHLKNFWWVGVMCCYTLPRLTIYRVQVQQTVLIKYSSVIMLEKSYGQGNHYVKIRDLYYSIPACKMDTPTH